MSNQYIFEPSTNGKVCLQTTMGDIDIELWSKEAPKACRNFIQLCMEDYYRDCEFHTIIKDCVTQTGDPTNTGQGGQSIYEKDFKIEPHQRLKFNRRGLIGMAASPDGFCGSQFLITLGPTPELNLKHTLFGKITGNTIFNLMNINDTEVDGDNRPVRPEKIISCKILSNPFDDIVPRRVAHEKKRKEKKEKRREVPTTKKNTGLLSFGDEIEEDDSLQVVSRSAHDVLNDEKLSKTVAVQPEELGLNKGSGSESDDKLSRVQQRLKKRKRKQDSEKHKDEDDRGVDFEDELEDQKKSERQSELERLAAESKALQKEYVLSLRGPKAKADPNDDSRLSEGMKSYKKLKLNFKSKTEGVVKSSDPQREDQTMALLNRFQTKMQRTTVQGVMANKQVETGDLPTVKELLRASAVPKPRRIPADMLPKGEDGEDMIIETIEEEVKPEFDEEATDEQDANWMSHILIAEKKKPDGGNK